MFRSAGLIRSSLHAARARTQEARLASTAAIWGRDAWRHEKSAFKTFVRASTLSGSIEERQMYAFLASCFGDVDVDKDGWIDDTEFDRLLEIVAALPRRFGLAPSWRAEYGTAERRQTARKAMFDAIDGSDGFKPRGKIAMGQFISWAKQHIGGKAPTLAIESGDVALRNVQNHTVDEYLAFLDKAVNDPESGASVSFYNHLLTIFVEADAGCKGRISFEEFNNLVDLAAASPRFFKLAPDTSDVATRMAMFKAMDTTESGFITFRKFLRFVREHVRGKIAEHKRSS